MLIKILEENNIIFIINGIAYKGRFIKASHYQKKITATETKVVS
jgi:hypothetical protein